MIMQAAVEAAVVGSRERRGSPCTGREKKGSDAQIPCESSLAVHNQFDGKALARVAVNTVANQKRPELRTGRLMRQACFLSLTAHRFVVTF